jgi:membrane-associated protease RseP (regulator of RpoE activity)
MNNNELKQFTFFQNKPAARVILLHSGLFILTFFTTCIAGALWANQDFTDLGNFYYGATYAVLILTFLTCHEFGHYIAARIHGVDATLPYYIPFPPSVYFPNFGTFGAVIKTKTPILSRKALFDIGAAGPIAGFIVCFIFLIIGLVTLPSKDFIYTLHPEYLTKFNGEIPNYGLHFGDTILYWLMAKLFANPEGWLPPMNEIYHYPFLNVGWFGLFVTSLNLLPLGQLDGGHIVYAMFGKFHSKIARVVFWVLFIIGFGSIFSTFYELLQIDDPNRIFLFVQKVFLPPLEWLKSQVPWYFECWGGWLFWAIIARIFIKLDHPPIEDNTELSSGRKALGWIAILIFILSFAWNGIFFVE